MRPGGAGLPLVSICWNFRAAVVQRAVAVVNKADGTGRDDLLQVELHQLAPLQAIPPPWVPHKGKPQLAFDQREHLVGSGSFRIRLEDRAVIQEELPVQAAGHALVAEGDGGDSVRSSSGSWRLTCQRGEGPATHQAPRKTAF